MTSDMRLGMAQSFRTSRSSFTSNNGYESPSLNPASVSNGEEYDSDGSILLHRKFLSFLFTPSTLSMAVPPELAGAIPLIDKFQYVDLEQRTTNRSDIANDMVALVSGNEKLKVLPKRMGTFGEELRLRFSTGSLDNGLEFEHGLSACTSICLKYQKLAKLGKLLTQIGLVESLTNQEEVEIRAKIEALGLEVTKVPSKSIQNLDELDDVDEMTSSAMAADPQVKSLLSSTADVWMPVITATSNERRNFTSSIGDDNHEENGKSSN
ncbi:hypothetical protein TEA_006175 [Camellia sinensis var. sinensis]|uniref:Uncharacterized protein n=1 Tax=Camellia sinensis var. sinensis TaxID=542762 RepID=A0A4S4DGE8_CAMSN|nr:hypothetical protein TEA_006175 [Camellia sinensis var. sinensis]